MSACCRRCGSPVRLERGSAGVTAYECPSCRFVGVPDVVEGRTSMRPRESKYGNVRTEVDGITFDSKAEAERWSELKSMERSGAIIQLMRQVTYPLVVNGVHVCDYRADFRYIECPAAALVVEDVKGYNKNPTYILKKKLMKACYGIDIREFRKNG